MFLSLSLSLPFSFSFFFSQGKRENLPRRKGKRERGSPEIFAPNSLDIHTARTHARHETISRLSSAPQPPIPDIWTPYSISSILYLAALKRQLLFNPIHTRSEYVALVTAAAAGSSYRCH